MPWSKEKKATYMREWRANHPEYDAWNKYTKKWRQDNREEYLAHSKAYNKRHREQSLQYHKLYHLKVTFKLSPDQYQILYDNQKGKCGICSNSMPNRLTSNSHLSHVDHNRACCPGTASCGKCIRGLLCLKCNAALGYVNDDIEILKKAIKYLTTGKVKIMTTKNNTPPSGKRIDDGPCPDAGYNKTKVPDGESVNSCEAFDGSKAVVPLAPKDYMDGACGI